VATCFFEDFVAGDVVTYGSRTLSADDIIAFASEYDPQPMHVDAQAARMSFAGTLIGSGWHTCAVVMRMFYDHVLVDSTSMGSPGVDEGRWVKPVRPGDTLRVRQTIVETRASRSRPDMGLVDFAFDVLNQHEETVYRQRAWVMFGRRDALPAAARPQERPPAGVPAQPEAPLAGAPRLWLDDLAVGSTVALGSHHFTAEEIVRFAHAFDPQPFHTDPEAARGTHFGALCASGWHTAAVWMKLNVAYREAETRSADAPAARLGPSPGFTGLRWLRPVYAGDRLTYSSTITARRVSSSRPGWGIVETDNLAVNAGGETVFRFSGAVFWERQNAG
jgi:acyl dehydratase